MATTEPNSEIIDRYINDWWGDYPSLALTFNNANELIEDIYDMASRDGILITRESIARRANALIAEMGL